MAGLYLVVTGLAVGWLVGLAVTPVLSGVLTSLLSVVIAAVAVLVGLPDARNKLGRLIRGDGDSDSAPTAVAVNVLPVMLLTVGIALGATAGLMARVNGIFVTIRATPETRDSTATRPSVEFARVGLYSSPVTLDQCERMVAQLSYPRALRMEMLSSSEPVLINLAANERADSSSLANAVKLACSNRK